MSFRCDRCKKQTSKGEPMTKRVVETRERVYPGGSRGWEIVREVGLCLQCELLAKHE